MRYHNVIIIMLEGPEWGEMQIVLFSEELFWRWYLNYSMASCRQNPSGNLVILIFSGQKTLYPNNINNIAFFFTLLKGYRYHYLLIIYPVPIPALVRPANLTFVFYHFCSKFHFQNLLQQSYKLDLSSYFFQAEKETDYEKQLKEEEKILDSIAEKKGLY